MTTAAGTATGCVCTAALSSVLTLITGRAEVVVVVVVTVVVLIDVIVVSDASATLSLFSGALAVVAEAAAVSLSVVLSAVLSDPSSAVSGSVPFIASMTFSRTGTYSLI